MEKSSFFDAKQLPSGEFDRVYNSEDVAEYFASFVGNGVYANPTSNLQVEYINQANSVMVSAGKAWINGYFYYLTKPYELTIQSGDASQPRVDTVVLRWDKEERNISLKVIQGTPSNSAIAPKPIRNDTKYDLVLAYIKVKAGAMYVDAADIIDKRFDIDVCGIVSGVIEQIDTTHLFEQYDSAFNTWFDSLQASLEGNVATNLANQIANKADKSELPVYPISISNGGTGATNVKDAWNNIKQKPELLWSGTWSSDKIHVPNADKYSLFLVRIQGETTSAIVHKLLTPTSSLDENFLVGVGSSGNTSGKTTTQWLTTFSASMDAKTNNWTYNTCATKQIVGAHLKQETNKVIEAIWGLI